MRRPERRRATDNLGLAAPINLEHYQRHHPDMVPRLKVGYEELAGIGGRGEAEIDEVREDRGLNLEGRRDKEAPIRRRVCEELDSFIERRVTPLWEEARVRRSNVMERGRVQPPTDPNERIAWETRASEVRAELKSLSPAERTAIWLASNDGLFQYACETAPDILVRKDGEPGPGEATAVMVPFLPRDEVERRQLARGLEQDPFDAETFIHDREALARTLEAEVNIMRREIAKSLPEPTVVVDDIPADRKAS